MAHKPGILHLLMWIIARHAEEKKFAEMKSLFDSPKPGMLTIFQALIDSKDDMPICEGGSRKRVRCKV